MIFIVKQTIKPLRGTPYTGISKRNAIPACRYGAGVLLHIVLVMILGDLSDIETQNLTRELGDLYIQHLGSVWWNPEQERVMAIDLHQTTLISIGKRKA